MDEQRLRDAYEIHCEVYGKNHISYETFRHKHLDNPDCAEKVMTLVEYQDGEAAGTSSYTRFPLLCKGKVLYAVHSNDVAVKPSFRGKHIFSIQTKQAISICEQTGEADLMLATPNGNSHPGFIKLGFREVGTLYSYGAVVRPVHYLCRSIRGQASQLQSFEEESFSAGGYRWQVSSDCPFSEEDLAVINGRGGVQVRRSRAYYQWKLGMLSKQMKSYICVRRGDSLCAFFVLFKQGGGKCAICDWMLPDERKEACSILRRTIWYLRRFGDMVVVQFVNSQNKETRALSRAGLLIRKVITPVMYRPITKNADESVCECLNDFSKWSLRSIDGDTILLRTE